MISVLVGRHPNCGLVINDPTVSRHHAKIVEVEPGTYLIKDENSTCGTFVFEAASWRRVSSSTVGETDRIRFGAFETSIKSLLRMVDGGVSRASVVERDPMTGAIVVRTP